MASRKYSPTEWEAQKPNIERLYLIEDRTVEDVITELNQQFGFVATYAFLLIPTLRHEISGFANIPIAPRP